MKTGLFFGSFNPIHIGHMALANYFLEYSDIEQLWFVISPHNPLKKKESLLADNLRRQMVELAIGDDMQFRMCMPQPSYTIDTLTYLSEKNPTHNFVILMGSDGLPSFNKWKNHQQIIDQYTRYIYPRETPEKVDYQKHQNIRLFTDAPRIEVSSSFIRQAFKEGKSPRYFLPSAVYKFIDEMNLYKK
jgi:nicotinate-nucleotide adenylyltransferase